VVRANASTAPDQGERLGRVREAVASVHDPEIPPCSIVDLGIVERVEIVDGRVEIDLLPTFAGCPALDVIREDVERAVRSADPQLAPAVRFVYSPAWTSDRISPTGREALRAHGITPPGEGGHTDRVVIQLAALRPTAGPGVRCPFCGSEDTVLESAFGPTLCRSTHFCRACRNPFEAFKPKSAESAR
jgi:ring-1,2-phenylacetyl-CoA epoxidase subunit PaaD